MRSFTIGLRAALAALLISLAGASEADASLVVPSNAKATCVVSSATFASWFQSGHVALNGVVNPANGITFPNVPNCSFYQWAQQMFLWATSPAPTLYGGGDRIFDSPTFYDVSPPDAGGNRTFIPHASGRIRFLSPRIAKVDAHGLQVVFSTTGQALEIQPSKIGPNGGRLILNAAGAAIEVQRVTLAANGKPVFLDRTGKTIASPRPLFATAAGNKLLVRPKLIRPQIAQVTQVEKFIINGHPIFLNSSGTPIPVEQGQADGSVLQAQNGSLIYYATIVNDVYAYFLTGQKDGAFSATQFPTTQAALNTVKTFAASHGKTFPDANALAVELKTSWVEAAGLANQGGYITTKGTIPTYNKSNPHQWVPNGQKTVLLALVGMHVVGSVNGHPEMIWSTFEHNDNAPNATYTYRAANGTVQTVAQNTAGTWLFCCANHSGPFDQAHMQQSGANIASVSPFTISPSDTIRWKAWGAASNVSPNPLENTTDSNTEIISLDHVIGTLAANSDVRNNYIFVGAAWTIGGAAPAGLSNEVGTSQLMDSTLETYDQGHDTTSAATFNCFACHSSNQTTISHVYPGLKPLF